MRFDDFDAERLATKLRGELPGVEAQLNLAHPARRLTAPAGVTPRKAGVLVLLYPEADQLYFPLIERSSHNVRDRHRGQISLPGGKFEASDRDLTHTALREAEEEVGADPGAIEVLGQLSTLYIPVSNFNVYPTVGITQTRPNWIPQVSEVNRVISTPAARLMEHDVVKHTEVPMGEGVRLRRVPYFDFGGEVVWGATAMILSELRQVLAS